MSKDLKIVIVAGARPNFIKIWPILNVIKKYPRIKYILVNTGQHYDFEMSGIFFQELKIEKPKYNLGVGSGTNAYQTGTAMIELEKLFIKEAPNLIMVVGDVNSTLAGALAASKLHIPVAHIESGLRSKDLNMPEEVNRILTDHISDFLFCTEPSAIKNLIGEGIPKNKMFYVGNVMIDTLAKSKRKIQKSDILKKIGLEKNNYCLLTLHRQENVDNKEVFENILEAIGKIQKNIKVVYPIHPRSEASIDKFKLRKTVNEFRNLVITKPVGYLDMLSLTKNSKMVLTDSGGLQEETTYLGVPCLTIRKSTERPITVEVGTNKMVGIDKNVIVREANQILKNNIKNRKVPKYWDGKAAERIIKIINNKL
jgi:UDP-N-acetylglucosamine 2-epimerase (non-hydrolysing)